MSGGARGSDGADAADAATLPAGPQEVSDPGGSAPPTEDELRRLPVHVVVRDYPETLTVFREAGVDVPAAGGEPVAQAVAGAADGAAGPDLEALLGALLAATEWRRWRGA